MGKSNWYNIEQVCKYLCGRMIRPQVFEYEDSENLEYYFADGELDKFKKTLEESRQEFRNSITFYARHLSDIVVMKRQNKEIRKKQLNSIKFITGDLGDITDVEKRS